MDNRWRFIFVYALVVSFTLTSCGGRTPSSPTDGVVPPIAESTTPLAAPASVRDVVRDGPYTGLAPEGSQARLGTGRISELAYSPGGSVLAVGGSIGVLYYDARTQEFLGLDFAPGEVGSMSFTSDGRLLAAVWLDDAVKVWEASSPAPLVTLEGLEYYGGEIYRMAFGIAFSPDGSLAAKGGSQDSVKLWDVSTGRLAATLEGHTESVERLAFSPDGLLLASGSWDGTVKLWDVPSGNLGLTLEAGSIVTNIAFSEDGQRLASAGLDDSLKIWEVATGELVATIFDDDYQGGLAFSPDGRFLISGSEAGLVKVWDISLEEMVRFLEGQSETVGRLVFSPQGDHLASVSAGGRLVIWEFSSGKPLANVDDYSDQVNSVAVSPDGRLLASGSWDETVKMWELSGGELRRTLVGHDGSVQAVAFSPDGRLLASGSADDTVKLWEVSTGMLVSTLEGHKDRVTSVVFSPDGRLLASGSWDSTVKLWQVSDGELLASLEGHEKDVYSVAFSPDGRLLASGSEDESVRIWEVPGGELRTTLHGDASYVLSVSFSPDGRLLAAGTLVGGVQLWDIYTGNLVRDFEAEGMMFSVAFSPDGHLLASGADDATIRVWDLSGGTLLAELRGHTQDVNSVTFSPDGALLVSGSQDGTVVLWDAPSPAAVFASVVDANGVSMIQIPAGIYVIGGDAQESEALCRQYRDACQIEWFLDEQPSHTVSLDAYWIDQFEVTNARYAECVEAGICDPPELSSSATRPSYFGNPSYDDFPVIYVSWEDASTYCEWRGARLPSEAEWETAARGGLRGTTFPWGAEAPVCDFGAFSGAKFDDGDLCDDTDTEAVGSYPANAYGIYDMAGNVVEWTANWYVAYPGGDPEASPNYGATYRTARGGSWYTYGDSLRVNIRLPALPTAAFNHYGFRCALSP